MTIRAELLKNLVGTFRYLDDSLFTGSLRVTEKNPWIDNGHAVYAPSPALLAAITLGILPGTGSDPGTPYYLVYPGTFLWEVLNADGAVVVQWPVSSSGAALTDGHVDSGVPTSSGAASSNAWLEDSSKSWTIDEFVGDTLFIDGGLEYTIVSNTATRITWNSHTKPDDGEYSIIHGGVTVDRGTSSATGGGDIAWVNDTTRTWTVNQHVGKIMMDSAGDTFTIRSNTATQLILATAVPVTFDEGAQYLIFTAAPSDTLDLTTYLPTLVPAATQGYKQYVVGTFLSIYKTPMVGGTVTFKLVGNYLIDAEDGAILLPIPIAFTLDANGAIPDDCYVWGGATYLVTVSLPGGTSLTITVTVPNTPPGMGGYHTVNLNTLIPPTQV